MDPSISLATELELRHAQHNAQRILREHPEQLQGPLWGLMEANLRQQKMLDGALARVIELRAQLAIAEMGAKSLAQQCAFQRAEIAESW